MKMEKKLTRKEKRYINLLRKDIMVDLISVVSTGIENQLPGFITEVYQVIYAFSNLVSMYDITKEGNSATLERKDTKDNKLSKLINRSPIVNHGLAMEMFADLTTSGDMMIRIESWYNLLYEFKLYLIANDDDEQVFRNAQYEVSDLEYQLLECYDEKKPYPIPDFSRVVDTRMSVEKQEIYKQMEQVKELIKKWRSEKEKDEGL